MGRRNGSFNRISTNRCRRRKRHAKSLLGKCPVQLLRTRSMLKFVGASLRRIKTCIVTKYLPPRYFLTAEGKTGSLQRRCAVDCALTKWPRSISPTRHSDMSDMLHWERCCTNVAQHHFMVFLPKKKKKLHNFISTIENRQTQAEGHLIKELIGSPQKCQGWDFPGGPVAETPCSQCRGPRFNP